MKKITKIMILADSAANPRTFPAIDACMLEDTYPYLLQQKFKNVVFWHNIMSNVTTENICSIAISYLNEWKPDVIILGSGINDARPEGIPEVLKHILRYVFLPLNILEKFIPKSRGVYKKFTNLLEHKFFIKMISGYRVHPNSYKRTLKRLKNIFHDSDIYCLEIFSDCSYENIRPGSLKRKVKYNNLLRDLFSNNFVEVEDLIKKILALILTVFT